MHEAGIAVIVGTPTYAVPAWLAAKHPDILVTTVAGQQKYGPRQIMDIVNPTFAAMPKNYPHADGPCATPSGDYRLATG